MKSWFVKVIAPLVVLVIAAGSAGAMWVSGIKDPRVVEPGSAPAAVDVVEVERGPVQLSLAAVGEVSAAQDVALLSEVSGTISWVDPAVHAGAAVSRGQVVARLDATTLDAEVAAARSDLATAQEALLLEVGSGEVAALEAELVGDVGDGDSSLRRREPQRARAEANVVSARAALASSERRRRLVNLRAPFDAILVEESLDVGRLVSASTELGRWVGTSTAEISVPVPASAVPWFEAGQVQAHIRPQGAAPDQVRVAESVGPTGIVDTATRTARVLVRLDQPYDTTEGPAILPGSFVGVTLTGATVQDASRLPVEALVDGSAVWSVDAENVLHKVRVAVVWRHGDEVVVGGMDGVSAVVARPSGTLLDGQSVRVRGQGGAR